MNSVGSQQTKEEKYIENDKAKVRMAEARAKQSEEEI